VAAKYREFEVKKFEERFTIQVNEYKAIDINFQKGQELEVIYSVQVQQNLPIDVWFVNEDHFLLLRKGTEFLYYIDATSQQSSYAKKIVNLTKHDNYKLVMTNYYNNQSVDVDIVGEIRIYNTTSNEDVSNYSLISIFIYSLIIVIIILATIIVAFYFKIQIPKKTKTKLSNKDSTKKGKASKFRKSKAKNKNKRHRKNINNSRSRDTKTKISSENPKAGLLPSKYCGYCGEPVDTPYCKICGNKV
jgi:hypothetical protein